MNPLRLSCNLAFLGIALSTGFAYAQTVPAPPPLVANDNTSADLNAWLDSNKTTKTRLLVEEALADYNAGDLERAVRKLSQASNADPTDTELAAIKASFERLLWLKQNNEAVILEEVPPKNRTAVKPDRSADDIDALDRNRYTGAFWVDMHASSLYFNKDQAFLSGFKVRGEWYPSSAFGVSAAFVFNPLDLNAVERNKLYRPFTYTVMGLYRFGWAIPAIEQTTTLTLKFGLEGEFIYEVAKDSYPAPYMRNYVAPRLEISMQDALLAHLIHNNFTDSLIFTPHFAIMYWPGDRGIGGVDLGVGISMRTGKFLVGPAYSFSYRSTSAAGGSSLKTSTWSINVSGQF